MKKILRPIILFMAFFTLTACGKSTQGQFRTSSESQDMPNLSSNRKDDSEILDKVDSEILSDKNSDCITKSNDYYDSRDFSSSLNSVDVSIGEVASSKTNDVTSPNLSKPFTNGSFTVQNPVSPWSDADVKAAWLMTDHYDKMSTFSDCVFADFTGDDIAELLLVCGHDKIFYIFQKDDDAVSLLAKSKPDPHIFNGVFLTDPPVDESDFTDVELDEYYYRDKFAVFEDIDKQKYLVIISWSGTLGEICEIKKFEIQGEKIMFSVVYRWGLFKEMGYNSMDMVMRYKKCIEKGGEDFYEEIQQREISDFLKNITIC